MTGFCKGCLTLVVWGAVRLLLSKPTVPCQANLTSLCSIYTIRCIPGTGSEQPQRVNPTRRDETNGVGVSLVVVVLLGIN